MPLEFRDKATDISFDFSANPISNDIQLVEEERATLQHMESVLLRDEYALIGRPGICAGLRNYVFEYFDNLEQQILRNKILNSLEHVPRIRLNGLNITNEKNTNEIVIEIPFTLITTDRELVYRTTLKRAI